LLFHDAGVRQIGLYFGWPISTSHSTVGAVIGYGIFAGSLNWQNLNKIFLSWLVSPIIGFLLSYMIIRLFDKVEIARTNTQDEKSKKLFESRIEKTKYRLLAERLRDAREEIVKKYNGEFTETLTSTGIKKFTFKHKKNPVLAQDMSISQ
jgi:phosphate/sulfate permease